MNNRSGLTLKFDSGKSLFFICPCTDCMGEHWDTLYAYLHARSMGWKFTAHKMFSEDGESVAVCPTCAKKVKWVGDTG